MKFVFRSLALFLWLVLATASLQTSTVLHGAPLPRQKETRLFWIERFSLETASRMEGLVGVMPSRGGRKGEDWSFEETIRTGSRSPVSPETVRWRGEIGRVASPEELPPLLPGESRLLLGATPEGRDAPFIPVVFQDGKRYAPFCVLSSRSTRATPGLLAATDLATFLNGSPIGAGQELVNQLGSVGKLPARVAVWESQHRAMAYLKFVPWALAVLLVIGRVIGNRLAGGASRRTPSRAELISSGGRSHPEGTRPSARQFIASNQRIADLIGRFVLAYPLGLLLAPVLGLWELWIYLGAGAIAGVVASFGERGVRAAAWATVLLLTFDQLLGGWVSARTPLSYSPLEAARFYGIGNEAGGYLIGAALLAAGGDVLTLALLGVATSALLGAPTLGANFGCFLASLVGFGVAIFTRLPKNLRSVGALGLTAVAALAVLTVVRGSAGTHVGRAAAGGSEGRATVIARKLAMNAHLTLTSPWALLAVVQFALLYKRRKDAGLLAGAGAAWLLNDSGVVAAALALIWAEKQTAPEQAPGPKE